MNENDNQLIGMQLTNDNGHSCDRTGSVRCAFRCERGARRRADDDGISEVETAGTAGQRTRPLEAPLKRSQTGR